MARLKDKLVVETKIPYKRKIGQNGKVEKSKSTYRPKVMAGRRGALHGDVLTHSSSRVNPDAFGDGIG